jgi:hypothetical protein
MGSHAEVKRFFRIFQFCLRPSQKGLPFLAGDKDLSESEVVAQRKEKAIERQISGIDIRKLADQAVVSVLDSHRGRV